MKKIVSGLFILAAALFAYSCTSAASPTAQSGTPRFKGSGGKDLSLAILIPETKGIAQAQEYLPSLVQGVFVNDIKEYSAIAVLDRLNLEKVLRETESGIYKNEADYMQLGNIANVGYAMTGSITKTSSNYALQMQIVDTKTGTTKASYSGNCTLGELENFIGVRKASMALLSQMGVELTDSAKKELSGAGAVQEVKAQTALAQGITAERKGNEYSAMANYFDAKTFNVSLNEASTRMVSVSSRAASSEGGGIRDRVLNELERRKQENQRKDEMKALLEKATAFYKAHQPFEIWMAGMSIGTITQKTVTIYGEVGVMPIEEEFQVIRKLQDQAQEMFQRFGDRDNKDTWEKGRGLGIWPIDSGESLGKPIVPGIWKLEDPPDWFFPKSTLTEFTVKADLIDESGKTIKRISFRVSFRAVKTESDIYGKSRLVGGSGGEGVGITIPIKDVTNTMSMRIVSINGKSVADIQRTGYVRIDQDTVTLE